MGHTCKRSAAGRARSTLGVSQHAPEAMAPTLTHRATQPKQNCAYSNAPRHPEQEGNDRVRLARVAATTGNPQHGNPFGNARSATLLTEGGPWACAAAPIASTMHTRGTNICAVARLARRWGFVRGALACTTGAMVGHGAGSTPCVAVPRVAKTQPRASPHGPPRS